MRHVLLVSACLVPCLAACTHESAAAPPVARVVGSPPPAAGSAPAPATATEAAVPARQAVQQASGGSLGGAIHDGNRAPPALRICAHPVDGGTPTCVDIAAGATSYRIAVAAGRYVIAAQALEDPAMKFAHAERIRCIRAPCPPDTAIEVEVAAGEDKAGIDLSVGDALPPG